jgi:hypothetical protein
VCATQAGVDSDLSFKAKAEQLVMRGYIGAIDAGSAAIHRKPTQEHTATVRLTVKKFLFRLSSMLMV